MSRLHEVVIKHQVLLEQLKVANAATFNQILPQIQKAVDDMFASLLGEALADQPRPKLLQIVRLLTLELNTLAARKQDEFMASLRRLSGYEASFEAATLTEVTREAIKVVPSASAIAAAISTPISATGDLLEPWVKDMTNAEVAMVNKLIQRGYAEGWTNQQMTTALRGTKAAGYKDGLLPKMGRHNATIVRTAVQHVSQTARETVWRENADIIAGYKWVSTLDGRTSQQCRSLDGQEFEIGKGPRPPIHPNCRSTTIPALKGALAMLSEGRTRASADGPVPANMTYYEWLRTQPADFQRSVLGPTKFDLFNAPGMTPERFAQLQLGSTFQPITLEQMAAAEALADAPRVHKPLSFDEAKTRAYRRPGALPLTGDFTPDEKTGFEDYTTGAYREYNRAMRSGDVANATYLSSNMKANLGHMIRYLASDRAVLEADMNLYRGMSVDFVFKPESWEDLDDLVGRAFDDPGFMSFSLRSETAADFGSGNMRERGVVMKLRASKGDRGFASVTHVSASKSEMEVVRRGGKFKIVGVEKDDFGVFGEMDVLIIEPLP